MKKAVIINGMAAPLTEDHLLVSWLKKAGFEVKVIEPLKGETVELVKEEPDVIIAWSLGGFLAPKLAERYPKSKLVLVASGIKVAPTDKTARKLFEIAQKEWGIRLICWGFRILPKSWQVKGYRRVNRMPEDDAGAWRLLVNNIDFFRQIPLDRVKLTIRFLKEVDNRELLSRLKNKTLIFGAVDDGLMPLQMSKEINSLIKGSRLVTTKGGHYNTFGQGQLGKIGDFLGVK